MKIAGGVISIVAGGISIIMAIVTLLFGGIGGALEAQEAGTVVGLGWAGLFLSFVIIAFAAASIAASSKFPSITVIVLSIITAFAGGTLVAIFMVLSLFGGILALIGVRKEQKQNQISNEATINT